MKTRGARLDGIAAPTAAAARVSNADVELRGDRLLPRPDDDGVISEMEEERGEALLTSTLRMGVSGTLPSGSALFLPLMIQSQVQIAAHCHCDFRTRAQTTGTPSMAKK